MNLIRPSTTFLQSKTRPGYLWPPSIASCVRYCPHGRWSPRPIWTSTEEMSSWRALFITHTTLGLALLDAATCHWHTMENTLLKVPGSAIKWSESQSTVHGGIAHPRLTCITRSRQSVYTAEIYDCPVHNRACPGCKIVIQSIMELISKSDHREREWSAPCNVASPPYLMHLAAGDGHGARTKRGLSCG